MGILSKARGLLSRTKLTLLAHAPGIQRIRINLPVQEKIISARELREKSKSIRTRMDEQGKASIMDNASLMLDAGEKYNLSSQQLEVLGAVAGLSANKFPMALNRKVKKALKTMSDADIKHMNDVARPYYLTVLAPAGVTRPLSFQRVKFPMKKFDQLFGSRLKEIEIKKRREVFNKIKDRQKPKKYVYLPKKGVMTKAIENLSKINDREMFASELRKVGQSGELNKKNLESLFKITNRIVPKQIGFLPYYLKENRKLTNLEMKFFKEKGLI